MVMKEERCEKGMEGRVERERGVPIESLLHGGPQPRRAPEERGPQRAAVERSELRVVQHVDVHGRRPEQELQLLLLNRSQREFRVEIDVGHTELRVRVVQRSEHDHGPEAVEEGDVPHRQGLQLPGLVSVTPFTLFYFNSNFLRKRKKRF